jgi:enamine deaminase RidA (YjgF/YER057c/UK114 family)
VSGHILNPDGLAPPRGFNHGILAPAGGRVLFVAGQAPTDADGRVVSSDFVAQFERALANAVVVVEAAGGAATDIGRLTIYVTDLQEYKNAGKPLGEAYRRVLGRHYPAMALVQVVGLVDDGARVEIEATAVVPAASGKE